MRHTLTPVEPPFDPEIGDQLARYPSSDGYILSLFRTFANSSRFLRKGVPNLLDRHSPLSLRTREIIILRVTANRNCEYEWGVHVTYFADAATLTPDEVTATRISAPGSDVWTTQEQTLIRFLDELCLNSAPTPETLAQIQGSWTAEQQLEILALCGAYTTISLVANTAGLAPEGFAARFPSGPAQR